MRYVFLVANLEGFLDSSIVALPISSSQRTQLVRRGFPLLC